MFDKPTLLLLVTLATLGPAVAYVIVKAANEWQKPTGIDAVISFLANLAADSLVWLIILNCLAWMHDEYEQLKANDDKPRLKIPEPVDAPQKRTLLDMNTGKPIYAFQTPQVKIDHMSRKVKHFCIVLINQREQGFPIDLREQTWKGHFGGRDNWVRVRDVRLAGAFAKEGSRVNSPFVVIDWNVVERGAKGSL